jgi:hypothetical protein
MVLHTRYSIQYLHVQCLHMPCLIAVLLLMCIGCPCPCALHHTSHYHLQHLVHTISYCLLYMYTYYNNKQIISPLGHSAGALYYDCVWTESPPEDTSLDFIDTSILSKLEGPRPSILRVNYIYGGIKSVYGTVSTLPVVNIFTPMVEGVVENVLSRTPLKVILDLC